VVESQAIQTSPCFCGATEFEIVKRVPANLFRKRRAYTEARIVRCVRCDLLRTSPTPVLGEDADFYALESVSEGPLRDPESWRRFARDIMDHLARYCSGGTLLDIGCNVGVLVDEANRRGFRAVGLDLNPDAVAYGVEHFRADLRCEPVQNHEGRASYDAIVMNHTIEHIHDLRDLLQHVRRLLKPDGIFLALCPNAEGGIPRLLHLLNQRKSGRGSAWLWYGYLPEEHVWQFGPRSLRRVLDECGMEVLDVSARQNMEWSATRNPGLRFLVMDLLWRSFARLNLGDNLVVWARPNQRAAS
jgi:SAM-dependent methyltransferase